MIFKKIRPLGKRVLIKRAEAVTKKGEIFLPDSAQEKPKQGKVVAVGPGEMKEDGNLIPVELNVGDLILFGAYAGTEVKHDDEDGDYLLMSEDDILAVLE